MLGLKTWIVGVIFGCCASGAHAEWPEKPLQLIVPFSAGGTIDTAARMFALSAGAHLGRSIMVVNKDGASGTIGTAAVAGALADGYTAGFIPNGPLTVQPLLNAHLPYTLAVLQPICRVFSYSYVLATHENGKFASLNDFIVQAKAAPQPLSYGIGGIATAPHFAMLQLSRVSSVNFLAVPFRGDPAVAQALKGGELDVAILTAEMARVQGFKILAAFSNQRLGALPKVATAKEQGFDVLAATDVGVFAPAKTPADIVRKLEAACTATVGDPRFQTAMQLQNQTIDYLDRESYASALHADLEVKRRLIESSGIRKE